MGSELDYRCNYRLFRSIVARIIQDLDDPKCIPEACFDVLSGNIDQDVLLFADIPMEKLVYITKKKWKENRYGVGLYVNRINREIRRLNKLGEEGRKKSANKSNELKRLRGKINRVESMLADEQVKNMRMRHGEYLKPFVN